MEENNFSSEKIDRLSKPDNSLSGLERVQRFLKDLDIYFMEVKKWLLCCHVDLTLLSFLHRIVGRYQNIKATHFLSIL